MSEKRLYIIYDDRANDNIDDATAIAVAFSIEEAKEDASEHSGAVCYSYLSTDDNKLYDKRFEFN